MPMWTVWKITDENFVVFAGFSIEEHANIYAENMNKTHDGSRYEVTKAGETPVW